MTANAPTTFSTDAPALHSALADRGYAARIVFVDVTDAPVWHDGEIVATVTGTFPAAYLSARSVPHAAPVVLLDNGAISALAGWRIERERTDRATANRVAGDHPRCIVDPTTDGPTLWDCPCPECAGLRADAE